MAAKASQPCELWMQDPLPIVHSSVQDPGPHSLLSVSSSALPTFRVFQADFTFTVRRQEQRTTCYMYPERYQVPKVPLGYRPYTAERGKKVHSSTGPTIGQHSTRLTVPVLSVFLLFGHQAVGPCAIMRHQSHSPL